MRSRRSACAEALAALRCGLNPLWPVLDAAACFWLGASIGTVLGWAAALAAEFAFPAEGGLMLGLRELPWIWLVAAVSGAVVAAVTTGVHAIRARA